MKLVWFLAVLLSVAYARVGWGPGEQEWGYVTVRPGAHQFYWLYYTTANVAAVTDRPLIVWLQGGPGSSGTGYGNFEELGPLTLEQTPRNYTWVKDANVMFVDTPVGAGFSYVDTSADLTTTNRQIADDFVELMRGFYASFPQFQTVPLYITCESYGGKMTIEIALVLYQAIQAGTIQANFKGVSLIDSWISPIDSVLTWAPYLLHVGAVDQDGFNAIDASAQATKAAVDAGNWVDATNQWGNTEGVIMNVAGNIDFYNILFKIPAAAKSEKRSLVKPGTRDRNQMLDDLMNLQVKPALGLTVTWGGQGGLCFNALAGDFMKPVTSIVEQVLTTTNLPVQVISGQLDLIVDTPGTVDWVYRLNWPGQAAWAATTRVPLVYSGINEGYVKASGNFGMYWINRSGHMVPADNPWAMAAMLETLTNNYSPI